MIDKSIRCDVCGIQKKETNHWYLVATRNAGDLHIRRADNARGRSTPVLDVCGQTCVHRLVDRWMETGSLDRTEVKES